MEAVTEVADCAGQLILEVYATEFEIFFKKDASPVTVADERAETLILRDLRNLLPGIPAIGEEAVSNGLVESSESNTFWLVDPVDGTKEFLRRSGEFTVNIALIHHGEPVLGVVTAPAIGQAFRACGVKSAERRVAGGNWRPIAVRNTPKEGVVVVSSRSHGDKEKLASLTNELEVHHHKTIGSSLKFCLIAEGNADIYPRYGPTSEWDTAAGHAILRGAGGYVLLTDGSELKYGKIGWRNPEFIARGAK